MVDFDSSNLTYPSALPPGDFWSGSNRSENADAISKRIQAASPEELEKIFDELGSEEGMWGFISSLVCK